MEFLERALTLSRSCGDMDTQFIILTTIADIKRMAGEAGAAQTHMNEAMRLAKVSANLFQEAKALQILAECMIRLGDYRNSMIHLHRAKGIIGVCGMIGGRHDWNIESNRAEVHLLKSEYAEARSIHPQTAVQ
jgi:hypothetical protein